MIDIPDLQTKNSVEKQDVDFWQMFHAVTVALQKAAHSETAVYRAYSEQIKQLGLYSSICWIDETESFLEVASIMPPRGVEFLLAKRPMAGARFPLDKIPVTRSVIENGRAAYEGDMVTLLFDGRLNPLIKLWPAAPRFLPHIPVIIAPLYRDGRVQGVLYMAGKTISPADLDAVTALAHHLSIALDNARLFQDLQTDITRRKQAEDSLRQSEEQFRILAENVPGIIYLCRNDPDFTVIYINKAVEELTGYPREMFLENKISFTDLYHPEDAPFINIEDEDTLQERGSFHHVYRIRHRSGEWRWVEEVGSGVFDNQGDLLFLEGVITDITERRQSELAQNALYRIAAIANTDITLDELFASIHRILSDLVDARNFYIAAYHPEDNSVSFPYFVDEKDSMTGSRPAGNGLTEYVAHNNTSHLLTTADIEELERKGIIAVRGAMPQIWLGTPLTLPSGTIGVMAMQSYTNPRAYTEKDKQLLQFV
ncbi:MAG TPA: PAS domain S-box protein, partial [Anaerolineae bacterium]|nr:PAS domain S-box protein [Anaerolineae bacterium]